MTRLGRLAVLLSLPVSLAGVASAQDADGISAVSFILNGQERTITQSAEVAQADSASFFSRDTDCAAICIQPLVVADGVATIDELSVIDFVASQVTAGTGLLIDSRDQDQRGAGAIATAINLPTALITEDNPFRSDILQALGAREFDGIYNFADAIPLVIFDNGPTATDASEFITTLVALGYPTDRIEYYRGGMQVWTALGLALEEI